MARCLPNTWGSKFVKCPYYKKHDQHQIVCEGINDKSTTHVVFGADYDLTNYMHKYCNDVGECKKCPLHSLLERKYKDE